MKKQEEGKKPTSKDMKLAIIVSLLKKKGKKDKKSECEDDEDSED